MAKRNSEVTCEVLTVLDTETGNNGDREELRVVSWNGLKPMLEKRSFWTNRDGEERTGKAKGFDLAAVLLICEDLGVDPEEVVDDSEILQALGYEVPDTPGAGTKTSKTDSGGSGVVPDEDTDI